MPAKTLEINSGVIMGSMQAYGGAAQLVQIPVGGIALPERVGLPIREAGVAIGVQISTARESCFAVRHEERPRCRIATCRQVFIAESSHRTREEQLTWAVALAMQANRAIRPGNVFDVDGERFLTVQTAIIDQPEERAISRVFNFSQRRLDFLCVQGASHPVPFRFPFDAIQKCLCYPSLLAEPVGETPQRIQTPIVRGRCK